MHDMEPQQNLIPQGEVDHEGAMAKADLYKLANYSVKLFKKLDDNAQLESWVQAKITKAADYIASVYHYLEYELEFSNYGSKLENAGIYNEEQKIELRNKLNEAKEMLKALKIAQAQKLEEAKSPKAKKDYDKDGKIESEKDEVLGSRIAAAKKAGKMKESWDDDDDEDDDSGYDKDDPKHPTWAERQRNKADNNRKAKKEKDINESWDDDDEDDDVKRADSELKKKGIKLPKVKHKEVPIKKTAKDKEEELDEGSGPYQLSDPKHPKFKANYEKFKKANPDKKLADFVNAMKQKDKVGGLDESWDDDDEDDDVKRADSELKKRGVKLPKVKHKEVPIKKTAKDKEEELDEGKGKKPDFLDLDKDGNKKEPMQKAAKEKKIDEVSSDTLKSYQNKVIHRVLDKKEPVEKRKAGFDKAEKMIPKKEKGEIAKSLKIDPSKVDSVKSDFKKLGTNLNIKNPEHHKMASTISKKHQEESINESADLARMKEFLTRLNG